MVDFAAFMAQLTHIMTHINSFFHCASPSFLWQQWSSNGRAQNHPAIAWHSETHVLPLRYRRPRSGSVMKSLENICVHSSHMFASKFCVCLLHRFLLLNQVDQAIASLAVRLLSLLQTERKIDSIHPLCMDLQLLGNPTPMWNQCDLSSLETPTLIGHPYKFN